ncbi:hypothetical protein [Umezakia ovalisporum]|uniref:hypothetical protein n=1 Tax=Umezakia ovalisporum TaxID=75695 RepID=UPI0039C5F06D
MKTIDFVLFRPRGRATNGKELDVSQKDKKRAKAARYALLAFFAIISKIKNN